jgi:iron complex outermembrane receptor protein
VLGTQSLIHISIYLIQLLSTNLTPQVALVQEDEVAKENFETVEKISVTCLRIKHIDLIATSPVITISEADIEITCANNVATFINELPSAGVPGSTDTASNFRTLTTGLSTVDLRNLGSNRTLILVNGRRHIGGSAGSTTVDVSMIAVDLVKRVEVVTG